ncbi:glycosyltransferase [Paracoccus marinaquae]|uniref:Rhamnosyl transferase n=1 Tax=Paracoccus marinaquae TaxID=2841926 RepID=A0ABS6AH76_9RHOB|nr:glycosyltransferase [Paracoccus marinaquae]MBU3029561.1 putative rhamnosyl transferase [Paracoccus marinaquae]
MRIQVLGLCRFSMLVENAFQTTGSDLQRNREILYDPRRLDQRLRYFENLCLSTLLWQTDPDFTLILATSDDLPQPWLDRLRAIAEAVPQIRLEQVAPGKHGQICQRLLERHTEPGADVVAQFRMDDDDAVACDYVARLRSDHRLIAPLMAEAGRVAVDYSHGLSMHHAAGGGFTFHGVRARMWVPALAMYFQGSSPGSIMNYRHDRIWQMLTSINLPAPIMWIRSFHASNDSPDQPRLGRELYEIDQTQLDKVMWNRFRLDPRELTGALTAPEGVGAP